MDWKLVSNLKKHLLLKATTLLNSTGKLEKLEIEQAQARGL